MTLYHLKFKNIKKEAVLAVKEIIKSGLFKKEKSINEKKVLIQSLHEKLCNIYLVPTSIIQYDETCLGTGHYDSFNNIIIINKTSLVTFLHEFYHMKSIIKQERNTEELARGWSISLYFLATPKLCIKAIESGKIMHQNSIINKQLVPEEN